MKNYVKYILIFMLLLVMHMPFAYADAVDNSSLMLWFAYEDSDEMIQDLNGGTTSAANLIGQGDAVGVAVNGIRIKAIDSSGTSTYLALMNDDGWNSYIMLPGLTIDSSGSLSEVWDAGPTYANVTGYTDPSYTFMLELGNYDENTDKWIVLAVSESETFSDLNKAGFVNHGPLDEQTHLEWMGTYVVPEPNAFVLCVLGFCFLSLRRKRIKF